MWGKVLLVRQMVKCYEDVYFVTFFLKHLGSLGQNRKSIEENSKFNVFIDVIALYSKRMFFFTGCPHNSKKIVVLFFIIHVKNILVSGSANI